MARKKFSASREQIHVMVDKDTLDMLKKCAEKDFRNVSDTVRMLIREYIEKNVTGNNR